MTASERERETYVCALFVLVRWGEGGRVGFAETHKGASVVHLSDELVAFAQGRVVLLLDELEGFLPGQVNPLYRQEFF